MCGIDCVGGCATPWPGATSGSSCGCVAATVPLDHFPGSNNGVLSVRVYYERICVVLIVWVGAPRHGQEQQVAAAVDVSLPLFLLITFQSETTVTD
ncbi:hypothetical protein J6590_008057 [Homalodisca vitripennis]|nr:hypothetical protein J6590_008057 [Homalodisca vitripennis]